MLRSIAAAALGLIVVVSVSVFAAASQPDRGGSGTVTTSSSSSTTTTSSSSTTTTSAPPPPTTTTTAAPVVAPPVTKVNEPGTAEGEHAPADFLACVLKRESEGQYGAVDPSGQWRGGYQFEANTWDNTARHAGRLDLVGVPPEAASPADQDAMAQHLYAWQGEGPWAGGRYPC